MDKSDPPTTFGIFKPVGHTVMAFRDQGALQAAYAALLSEGFPASDMVCYSSQEMIDQVDSQEGTGNPLAWIGQEINLIRAHRELAYTGCGFLVVKAANGELSGQVADVARSTGAVSAQHYGHFIIEELLPQPTGHVQRPESMESGLDTPTPHGPTA